MVPDFRGIESFEEGQVRLSEIQNRFAESAQSIMFEHDLVFHQFCEKRTMQITSLELYLHCKAWPDPNTDMDLEQLNRETWYVLPGRYIDRIDITAGCRCENIYCGLLIRAIAGDDGPNRALRQIIRGPIQKPHPHDWRWLPEEIGIVEQIRGRNVLRGGPLRLIPNKIAPAKGELWIGPRVNVRGPDLFRDAPLRVANRNVGGHMACIRHSN